VRGRPAGVRRPVRQDHVTLALASLPIGLRAMVADEGLGIGFSKRLAFASRIKVGSYSQLSSPALIAVAGESCIIEGLGTIRGDT
jgi:hypothetical protein